MKFLVHSDKTTYNTVTKKYSFAWSRREQGKKIKINQFAYSCVTNLSPLPHVVYVRSDALSRMIRDKHTLQLEESSNESNNNIIAVLHETHDRGRYRQEDSLEFTISDNHIVNQIDLFFTSGETVLDGEITSSSSGSGTNSSVTDQDIINIGDDLQIWIDLAPARTLSANFSQCENVGDLPKYLYSRAPTNAGLILEGNWDFELIQMNSNAISISRDTSSSGGHGTALTDSSLPTALWEQQFQVHTAVKMPASYNDTTGFFALGGDQCRVQTNSSGGVKFVSSAGTVVLTNIAWIPSRTYILSIKRVVDTAKTSGYAFHWRWEDLDGATTVTEITDSGATVTTTQANWSLGVSGVYFRHQSACLIGANGIDSTVYDNCISWLKKYVCGESTAVNGETTSSTTENAQFFGQITLK